MNIYCTRTQAKRLQIIVNVLAVLCVVTAIACCYFMLRLNAIEDTKHAIRMQDLRSQQQRIFSF